MSKFNALLQEVKISNTDKGTPRKTTDPQTGEFKYFTFNVTHVLSKKDRDGQWLKKKLTITCKIWSEQIADKFMNAYNPTQDNYITILNGYITDFHICENEQGYKAFSNFQMTVNEFVITHKPIDEERESIRQEQATQKPSAVAQKDTITDDEIPF